MDKFMDWICNLPKIVVILFAVLFLGGFGYLMFNVISPKTELSPSSDGSRSELLTVPGATESVESTKKTDIYVKGNSYDSGISPEDYFSSLVLEDSATVESTGELVVTAEEPREKEYLDPSVYSEIERYYIETGVMTKMDVDAVHAKQKADDDALQKRLDGMIPNAVTSEQEDSLYFVRMEKAMKIAQKYSPVPGTLQPQQPPEEKPSVEPERKEPRRINLDDVQASPIASASFQSNGIINSLEDDTDFSSRGVTKVVPARATFLKTEKILDGQRVIMRLMQDLKLSDGTLIPSNTHITGTCSINERLEINVKAIQYAGRVYYTDLCIYDNDGIEGIYCPVIQQKKGKRAGKNIGTDIVNSVASTATSIFTGNPLLGRTVSQGIRELSMMSNEDGTVVINVVSGYEFYVFENMDDFLEKNRKSVENSKNLNENNE